MAAHSRRARPTAWTDDPLAARPQSVFPSLCDGVVAARPPMPTTTQEPQEVRRSSALTLDQRRSILEDIQVGLDLKTVARRARATDDVVRAVIQETVAALIDARMETESAERSLLTRCEAINSWQTWARVARQPKHDVVLTQMQSACNAKRWLALRGLRLDWKACRQHEWLALRDGHAAARLIQFLLDAGVPPGSLAVTSAHGAPPLPTAVARFKLQSTPAVKPYRGRAANRLVLTAHGLNAATAKAGTVTMEGLHWCFVLLSSALFARGHY